MSDPAVGISVVITVKNEGKNLEALFTGFAGQDPPFEIVLVDSGSTDNTSEIVRKFSGKINVNHIVQESTRGQGRNIGVENASYGNIVFTDGDVKVSKDFISGYRKAFTGGYELIAGEVIPEGVERFKLERVKLFYDDFEITRPSANLGYTKQKFQEIGGFDPTFVTAEDIDLNLRAVRSGAKHTYCEECLVYNRTRETYSEFMKQAFWNGFGRRQLKAKNRKIWVQIRKGPKIGGGSLFPHLVRLGFGALGYITAIFRN